jgi:hypothetical protein
VAATAAILDHPGVADDAGGAAHARLGDGWFQTVYNRAPALIWIVAASRRACQAGANAASATIAA